MAHHDTELADRLLAQRLKAALFGATTPPLHIGPYRLASRLGAGGMGVVYRAHDPELGRDIALKLMHPELTGAVERIRREARALARLAHPNVVTVFGTGDHEGRFFVAMEFVEGTTLREWLEQVRATRTRDAWRAVLERFLQAARGLQAAHAAGLVHCDFKPENVLVGNDGRVRVVDFGIASPDGMDIRARELADAGRLDATMRSLAGEAAGTPAYMAPEQFRGGPVDARTDQFAFCVALHEALVGARPFAGETLDGLMDAVLHQEPAPLPRRLPRPLRSLIARGLAREPDRRFPDMAAIIEELGRMLAPRSWRLVAAGASALCLAAVVAAVLREPAAPAQPTGPGLLTWIRAQVPSLCLAPSPALTDAAYITESERLVAEAGAAIAGSREYYRSKARLLALQLARGNLDACKTAAMTLRSAPDMPWASAAEFRCLWARHCTAPAGAACPPGLAAQGVAGCRPLAKCAVRGLSAQADACLSGQVECCRVALVQTQYTLQRAGEADAPEARAEQRRLAEAGCTAGHAELCLEAAKLGMDVEPARRQACELHHQASCGPATTD
ncbi:serine/threonine-protein kinase [Nannocystis exedens]|uniref:serine/threonine-protein kinase n=1 Tax=Nannocystis exedens TaxID=54 RepID=UPI00147329E4|nr:serine/threonine-protein kinase [Nannocystis exedens]